VANIFDDKGRIAYILSFIVLGAFAAFLLGKCDLGAFIALERTSVETRKNRAVLERTSEYEEYIKRFDSQFTKESGTNWLIEALTDLAEKEGLTLTTIRPLETRPVSGYREARISADGNGPYPNLLRLISLVESYKRYIYIERLTVAGEDLDYIPGRSSIGRAPAQAQQSTTRSGARVARFALAIASFSPAYE